MDSTRYNEDVCPDCGSDWLTWIPSSATEPGEWSCDVCNGRVDDTDSKYDDWKDSQ
jgi:hypothetical protein